jgi:23S rRNA (cytidine1920-2'-O)/16S rRNA (cytidine1409-2'-O)-methyltransferase
MSDSADEGLRRRPQRLDVELVQRGLFASRAQARAAIEAGKVRVDDMAATKPGQIVSAGMRIEAEAAHPWVSRGGVKLAHALDVFGAQVAGRMCVDVGASTGGFTEVLLARGARRVCAVDVGRGQLHARVREDARVMVLEEVDARELTLEMLGERAELVVCDASFIGLAKVLPRVLELTVEAGSELVALFKPQFEVGPGFVGKGGLVKDAGAVERAAREVESWLVQCGWTIAAWAPSPILGGDGNEERLLHALRKSRANVPAI